MAMVLFSLLGGIFFWSASSPDLLNCCFRGFGGWCQHCVAKRRVAYSWLGKKEYTQKEKSKGSSQASVVWMSITKIPVWVLNPVLLRLAIGCPIPL